MAGSGFAHIDGLVPADPAICARLPKVHRDESRTQGPDRLELIRFLQVSQRITVQGMPGGADRRTRDPAAAHGVHALTADVAGV